jgi:hypothetical protein
LDIITSGIVVAAEVWEIFETVVDVVVAFTVFVEFLETTIKPPPSDEL